MAAPPRLCTVELEEVVVRLPEHIVGVRSDMADRTTNAVRNQAPAPCSRCGYSAASLPARIAVWRSVTPSSSMPSGAGAAT